MVLNGYVYSTQIKLNKTYPERVNYYYQQIFLNLIVSKFPFKIIGLMMKNSIGCIKNYKSIDYLIKEQKKYGKLLKPKAQYRSQLTILQKLKVY